MLRILLAVLTIASFGCADTPRKYSAGNSYYMPYSDDQSTADGDAWTGSAMYPRKQMPAHSRGPANDWDFYYKHCAMNGNESYFSKTAYDCSGPYQ